MKLEGRTVGVIPARMGSQRLPRKNLRHINGMPLIEWAIMRCKAAGVFDEIIVNSEASELSYYAEKHDVSFYLRPDSLGSNEATSEDFIRDFLERHECKSVVQIHSITPLLTAKEIRNFVNFCTSNPNFDTVLSCIDDQIEVAFQGVPVNFSVDRKTNSQDLVPLQRITWAATKWDREVFLNAVEIGNVGTYSGELGYFTCDPMSAYPIKTEYDLKICNALFMAVHDD